MNYYNEIKNELINMCRWIDSEKTRRSAINSFNSVKVKYFNPNQNNN